MNSVLIVDDSKTIRDLLEKIFSNMFFATHTASNGEEALKSFQQYKQNVIILDPSLPLLDGYNVLYTIRQMPDITQPKIIFCSATNTIEAIKKAIKNGCDDYIIKPFDEEIVATKLKILEVI